MNVSISLSMRNVVGPHIREARYRAGQKVTQQQLAARLQTLGLTKTATVILDVSSDQMYVSKSATVSCLPEEVRR